MEMSTEAVNALNEFTVKLIDSLEQGANLASEQVPLILEELLLWKTVQLSITVLLGMLLLLAAYRSIRALLHPTTEEESPKIYGGYPTLKEEYLEIHIICGSLGSMLGTLLLIFNVGDLLQVTLAPRIFLLEYATNLIK